MKSSEGEKEKITLLSMTIPTITANPFYSIRLPAYLEDASTDLVIFHFLFFYSSWTFRFLSRCFSFTSSIGSELLIRLFVFAKFYIVFMWEGVDLVAERSDFLLLLTAATSAQFRCGMFVNISVAKVVPFYA